MKRTKSETTVISFRIDAAVLAAIEVRAAGAGISAAQYAREVVAEAVQVEAPKVKRVKQNAPELLRLHGELTSHGRLLNQIARSLNSGDPPARMASVLDEVRCQQMTTLAAICDALGVARAP